ncbi:MAG: D-aminoacyl-tRNA deacylase, partial [Flavihumibacter sp.]
MRVVIQRVRKASVTIGEKIHASIEAGLLVLLGIEDSDTAEDLEWLCARISRLRIFNDENGVMNLSVMDTGGGVLVVSQFTLYAATKKGNRPSYIRAAGPAVAVPLYEAFLARLADVLGRPVGAGVFGAVMLVSLENDGP